MSKKHNIVVTTRKEVTIQGRIYFLFGSQILKNEIISAMKNEIAWGTQKFI
jgi:hypothetical protein